MTKKITVIPNRPRNIFSATRLPIFSWKLQASQPGQYQQAYRIIAASAPELLPAKPDLWDSGFVYSEQADYICWGGVELESRQRVYWAVRVVDRNHEQSEWSEIVQLENALLEKSDWIADWISFNGNNASHSAPCPFFRRDFQVAPDLESARLYITARGLFESSINGNRIADDYFVPGWTDFKQQIQYLAYDVTDMLQAGENCLGVILGDGWHSGYLSGRRRNNYGMRPELLAQLELNYADGSRQVVVSDKNWKCATGPILYSDIYDGEMYDARLEMPGWDTPGFDAANWQKPEIAKITANLPELVLKKSPPARRIMEIKPVERLNPHPHMFVYDLGQNISGWVKISVKGNPGILYTIRFGEMLNSDKTIYNLNYRSARSTDYYVCKGSRDGETWEPRFTFHGFRYVQIDGFQFANVNIDDIEITGVVVHSDLEMAGGFSCSNAKINRLYSNICWGQRDNFLEIPTDCPQRDERLGWTGDAQIFIDTAICNMDVLDFFVKWLRDLRETQRLDGAVAHIAPNIFLDNDFGAAAWSDAIVICPWALYLAYGDVTMLVENYAAMSRWIDYQETTSSHFLRPEEGYGDWLALSDEVTPRSLIGTAYFAHTCAIMAKVAKLLDKPDDAARFELLCRQVKSAFIAEFTAEDGSLRVKTQTACILALHFKLLPDELRQKNEQLFCELIRQAGHKLNTGFVGTGMIAQALSECGAVDLAYDLLFQEDYPSWLFSVNQGATTTWERWNSFTKESGFGDVNMNSFNHYAFGAIGKWLFSTVAGIDFDPAAPGGKNMLFAAQPDPRLKHAGAELITRYGKVSSYWIYHELKWNWHIEIPPNSSGSIVFPFGGKDDITINNQPLNAAKRQHGKLTIQLPNGRYDLSLRLPD